MTFGKQSGPPASARQVQELLTLLQEAGHAGFRDARHVSAADLAERYFKGRPDGLRPPYNAEELLIATT